ncbi:hypothetical protein HLB44_32325 [Aquincola sp. S2]|uniref:Uncharacterized protein n=1 Tax=Pseudaquabacterium terrae TaxID=2732868 RepID=A0ABX2ESG2_9BURK|nr:hypothetical protein [Aquabacterium terrae]NRF71685.1 hypothetical protein [Aquabacterium terrae]
MQRSTRHGPSAAPPQADADRPQPPADTATAAQLQFLPRAAGRRLLAFPCNPSGQVEIDLLSAQARNDYLFARALRGRDYAFPIVVQVAA